MAKYIVFGVVNGSLKLEIPIIFPEICVHALVAKSTIAALKKHWKGATITPVAAGLVSSMDLLVECTGKSESMDLASRGEVDSQLIRMSDYGSIHV